MKKHSALAVISFLSFAALSACGSPGGGSGGKGGRGEGGEGGEDGTGGRTGGTGGRMDASIPRDTGATPAPDGGAGDTAGSCEGPPDSLLCKPLAKFPMTIKETGYFPMAPDLDRHPAAMREYVPDPALWSDGMEKQRFIVLPAGAKIDNTNRQQWAFPDGTVFIKTFFDDTRPGRGRPIETRFMRKVAGNDIPEFYLYKWNAEGTDATLLVDNEGIKGDINADEQVAVTIKRTVNGAPFMVNNGMPFMHTLPSRQACGNCHEENAMHSQAFIGFDEIRLNSKFPSTAAKTQLELFAESNFFSKPIPTPAMTITYAPNDSEVLKRIKKAVFGNCVHCHGGVGVFNLRPDVFVEQTVNKPTESQSIEVPDTWFRVKPRVPNMSVLYIQARRVMIPTMVNGMPVRMRPMPTVGVADVAADQQLLADLNTWILSLPP